MALDLARGLAAVHRAGALYRDIKPANAVACASGWLSWRSDSEPSARNRSWEVLAAAGAAGAPGAAGPMAPAGPTGARGPIGPPLLGTSSVSYTDTGGHKKMLNLKYFQKL